MGCRLWDHTESDKTEATEQQQQQGVVLSLLGSPLALKMKRQGTGLSLETANALVLVLAM